MPWRADRFLRGAACAALSLLLLTASAAPAFARNDQETLEEQIGAYQQQIREREEKLNRLRQDKTKQNDYILALQEQADDLEAQTAAIQKRMDALEEEIQGYDGRITSLADEIGVLEQAIAARQTDIDQTYGKLSERLRAMYMTGGISQLEFYFGAKDLAEFLNRVELMARTNRHDKALIDTVNSQLESLRRDQDDYQQSKAALDQQKAECEAARSREQETLDQLTASKREAEQKKRELTGYVEQLDKDSVLLYELNDRDLEKIEDAQDEIERIIAEKGSHGDGAPPPVPETPDPDPSEPNTPDSPGDEGPPAPDAPGVVGKINSDTGFCWPLPELLPGDLGYVSSHYGYRTHPVTGQSGKLHTGVDLSGSRAMGRPIVAVYPGVVILSRENSGYGNCVMIDHGNGRVTLYGHCSKLLVREGQTVQRGEKIAEIGNSGVSSGPHCHFEVRINGGIVNPESYLPYDVPNLPEW